MPGSLNDTVTLANGVKMPALGFGTWQLKEEGGQVEQAVAWALELGYRHLDTATIYANEAGVGRAMRASGIPREQIFLTTKVWNADQGYDSTLRAFDASLAKLDTDYVDLYLVHWPVVGKYHETWRAVTEIYNRGRAKAVGVSNFLVHHLRDLRSQSDFVPHVDQVEFHPHLVQPELLQYCAENKIQVEAWSPLMRGQVGDIAEIQQLAATHRKTPAQIVLRWDLQHGLVTIPRSSKRERIAENADLFDFELSAEEMTTLDRLDQHRRIGPDPDNVNF